MFLARVVGNVVATVKHAAYHGRKVMAVQPVDELGKERGRSFLSVDFVQAGPGDLVLVVKEGSSSRQVFGMETGPVHSVIVGIVDKVDTEPEG
jgi:ethanolamine utilization protein EutN